MNKVFRREMALNNFRLFKMRILLGSHMNYSLKHYVYVSLTNLESREDLQIQKKFAQV
jgi:hypothetical protein